MYFLSSVIRKANTFSTDSNGKLEPIPRKTIYCLYFPFSSHGMRISRMQQKRCSILCLVSSEEPPQNTSARHTSQRRNTPKAKTLPPTSTKLFWRMKPARMQVMLWKVEEREHQPVGLPIILISEGISGWHCAG